MNIQALLMEKESEWLDFKQEYHKNNVDFLHDILCLANSESPKNRLLIFGVSDDKSVVGVENCEKRKKQSHILDLIKNSPFNHLPIVNLHTMCCENHEIDILEIENRPDKPYFFKKDKECQGKTIRAGVIYTRYGDTNTPLNGCADELYLERMFRERFGIDKRPLEQLKISLTNTHHWQYSEAMYGGECFYDEWNPEFTLSPEELSSEEFREAWAQLFADSNAHKYEMLVKFHSTVLRRLIVVSCDGGRYLSVLPNRWASQDKATKRWYFSHFFIKNSLEHLVNEMIQNIHPMGTRKRGAGGDSPSFPVFDSEEAAKEALDKDFEQGMQIFDYYFFDCEKECHVRIHKNMTQTSLAIT